MASWSCQVGSQMLCRIGSAKKAVNARKWLFLYDGAPAHTPAPASTSLTALAPAPAPAPAVFPSRPF